MTTLQDIEQLVATTAKQALAKETPIQSRIEALKVIAPYYLALKKADLQVPDESGDEPTIEHLRDQMKAADQEVGNGGTVQARSRSRRN